MKKFVSILLVIAFILAFNNAAFGCNCGCIPTEETATVEETITEEVATEEEVAEEAAVEEVVAEDVNTEEEVVECEAFSANTFEYAGTYSDTMALEYEEPVVVEETVIEEAAAEEEIVVVEEPVVEEETVIEEEPTIEEVPVEEDATETTVDVTVVEKAADAVEKTVEAAKPVIEKAQTAYVQTGCDQVVNTFMMQLCVMLAAIVALSVLLKYAVKQNK